MNEEELFNILSKKKKETLLQLLKSAYSEMKSNQRALLFDHIMYEAVRTKKTMNEKEILDEVNEFYKQSLAGHYYAPFMINSQNFMDTPEETDEWCTKIRLLLEETSQLTALSKHKTAIECFEKLFELLDRIGDDEIIFGDEVGTWIIGADEEKAIKSYVISLAKTTAAKKFVDKIIPLLKCDSYYSFINKVYDKIEASANKEQKAVLDSIIKEQGIKINRHTS